MRFAGTVGYATSAEVTPGVWMDTITEYQYYGKVVTDTRRLDPPPTTPPTLNMNVTLGSSFIIVADAQAYANYLNMRYVIWDGVYWTITGVEVDRPCLTLTVGGIWNGVKA